jgi:glycerol uptake facilitator-like aquaporin
MNSPLVRATIMEFIGAFAIAFASVKMVNTISSAPPGVDPRTSDPKYGLPTVEVEAAKVTFCLAFFTWAGLAVSGSNFNPLITIAMFMARRLEPLATISYIAAQAAGALTAGFLQFVLTANARSALIKPKGSNKSSWHYFLPYVNNEFNFLQGIVYEGIASFFFIIVYCAMMVEKGAPKGINCFAVGCAYGLAALTIGYATGACLNPFIYIMPRLFTFELEDLLSYVVGPMVGTVAGGVVFRVFLLSRPKKTAYGRTSGSTDMKTII